MNDFILELPSFVPEDTITAAIEACENAVQLAAINQLAGTVIYGRTFEGTPDIARDDAQVFEDAIDKALFGRLSDLAVSAGERYRKQFKGLASITRDFYVELKGLKLQKTLPEGGFHTWHCELNYNMQDAVVGWPDRELAWMFYLNDVEYGGETEFLYQHARVKPRRGTAVVWPVGWTHMHRGNPPYSGVKYIATGLLSYRPQG